MHVVNRDISDGQREFVLRTGCVETAEVDANSDLPVLLSTCTMLATQFGCYSSRMKQHSMSL